MKKERKRLSRLHRLPALRPKKRKLFDDEEDPVLELVAGVDNDKDNV